MRDPIIGGNFSAGYHARAKYGIPEENGLLVIDQDTRFVGSNFAQASAHTRVFDVRNGARLILRDCNAVNVTLPDEMAPGDFTGNNAQVVALETGNPDRPTINGLCPCEKCATFVRALRADIASGAWNAGATIIDVKASARIARLDAEAVAADVAFIVAENAEAVARIVALPRAVAEEAAR